MTAQNGRNNDLAEMDRIYEQHGKPLEAEHWGEFLAVAPDGRALIGQSVYDVAERSTELFGLGGYLFKIGERSIGTIR